MCVCVCVCVCVCARKARIERVDIVVHANAQASRWQCSCLCICACVCNRDHMFVVSNRGAGWRGSTGAAAAGTYGITSTTAATATVRAFASEHLRTRPPTHPRTQELTSVLAQTVCGQHLLAKIHNFDVVYLHHRHTCTSSMFNTSTLPQHVIIWSRPVSRKQAVRFVRASS